MYLTAGQSARRLQRRIRGPRTLGLIDPFGTGAVGGAGGSWDPSTWDTISSAVSNWWTDPGIYLAPVDQSGQPVPGILDAPPGGDITSWLANAVTGRPTQAQLDYNAADYTNAAANMARVLDANGVPLPAALQPGAAAQQAANDQANYASATGGSANQAFSPMAGATPATWAWLALGGIVALMVVTRR